MFLFGLFVGIIALLLIESTFPRQTMSLLTWISLRNRQLMEEIKKHMHNKEKVDTNSKDTE